MARLNAGHVREFGAIRALFYSGLESARLRGCAGDRLACHLGAASYCVGAKDPTLREVPGGNEYPWAFVTSWRDADVLQAVSANDAEGEPAVRAGKPIVPAADRVVDRAVWVDSEGIVEGGWTNAALGA
jgi:hypothetical protein